MNYKSILLALVFALIFIGCNKKQQTSSINNLTKSGLSVADFNATIDGKENKLYVLCNSNGMEVTVTNFGARIVSILVPDKDNNMKDVVLGFDSIGGYLNNKTDFGASIGRYGNRIAKGKFTLNGKDYQLTINNGENSLHGGTTGFQYKMFDIVQLDSVTLECSLVSPDGDNGYPGTLITKVTYRLTDENAIDINYEATTDKPTIINLTNHSYFNLSGDPTSSVLDHVVYMNSDSYTPVDATMIPTGDIVLVEKTPMDFTIAATIGERIDDVSYEQLKLAGGYDHNWIFKQSNTIDSVACKLYSPQTGIVLEVYTTEPAVQFYSGNFLDGTLIGKQGIVYQKRAGLCLETQHYPDSPNHPNFPSTVLNPGETYTSRCIYKFSVIQ